MITRLIAFLLTLGLVLGDLPAFAAGLARLTELKGDVQVQPKGGAWHAGALNEELNAGDAVKTGAQSSATLVRQDGTELELMPFAQLAIEDENGFNLTVGRVWSHFVKSLGLPFFIRTPNATALIRGTTLGVGFEEERSRVVVYEGLVEVQGRDGGRQDVASGFRVDVDRMGRLERMERADAREIDEGRLFRVRRGLEEGPERGMLMPGRGDRPERGGEQGREGDQGRDHERMEGPGRDRDGEHSGRDRMEGRERDGERSGRERMEGPGRERMERPEQERVEGLERRMERVERRTGDRLELHEERESLEHQAPAREGRQETTDPIQREVGQDDRQPGSTEPGSGESGEMGQRMMP